MYQTSFEYLPAMDPPQNCIAIATSSIHTVKYCGDGHPSGLILVSVGEINANLTLLSLQWQDIGKNRTELQ